MAIYVAESYLARERAADLESQARRLRDATPASHLFSWFVADDEVAFHCVMAPSLDAARAALERAGVIADRIVGAAAVGPWLGSAALDPPG